jgi:hypothetical protein
VDSAHATAAGGEFRRRTQCAAVVGQDRVHGLVVVVRLRDRDRARPGSQSGQAPSISRRRRACRRSPALRPGAIGDAPNRAKLAIRGHHAGVHPYKFDVTAVPPPRFFALRQASLRRPRLSRIARTRSRSRSSVRRRRRRAPSAEIGDEEDATGLPPGPAFRQARYCRRSRISGTEVPCLSGRDGAPGDADTLAIAGQAAARRRHSRPRHQGRRRSLRAARVRDHRCVHAVLSVWLPARAPAPAA